MSPTRIQTQAVARFSCLGPECPDTCCQGWGMQLTSETFEKYQQEAPELLDVVTSGEAELIMRRDADTDVCVKFDHGWCGIHRDYGDEFLGDACHFFPRITRAFGSTVITSAALSCPEAARQMLYVEDGFAFTSREEIRAPYSLKNYLPPEVPEADALALHEAFLALAADETVSAEQGLLRVSAVARALERQPQQVWHEAMPLYTSMADGRIPAAEGRAEDIFNLLHALYGLVMATPSPRARLTTRIETIAEMLGAQLQSGGGMQLSEDALQRGMRVMARMQEQSPVLQPVLRRYVQAQLSQALFPFAGLGRTLSERITIIGVRFSTVKLALASLLSPMPSEAEVVEVVQIISRFMDHLADPALSMAIYEETGWAREPRLRAIVGG